MEQVENVSAKHLNLELVPKWLTAEIFEELLKQHVDNFQRIVTFKAYPALNPGENYATVMLRVTIEIEVKDSSNKMLSFMMKLPHDHESVEQLLNFINQFHIERDMTRDVLPELEQMYRDAGVEIKFGATSYLLPTNPNGNYVLMNDLGPLGWKNANRTECLDMAHVKLVLQKLAQYHAASAVRVATRGPFAATLMQGLDKKEVIQIYTSMILSFQDAFMNNIKSFENGEKYEKSFANFFKLMSQLFDLDTMKYDPDEFNVLCHGDCWSNNFLFKYNSNNEVEGVTFIDFQMPRWGSPVCDLLYFIFSSVRIDIKLKHFDYFIRFYHENLVESLKLLRYQQPLPLLRDLFSQTCKYFIYGPLTAYLVMPLVLFESSEKSNYNNFASTDQSGVDFKNMLFANKRYHMYINELLPWFYNRGWLTDEEETLPMMLKGF